MANKGNVLDLFALKFAKIIEKYTDYIIVSGFVAISSGRTRATEDIDIIIKPVKKDTFYKIHSELIKAGLAEVYRGSMRGTLIQRYIRTPKPRL